MDGTNYSTQEVVKTFNKARASDGGPYNNTVGYGEKYPQYEGDNLVVEMNNRATGIHYPDQAHERGYDQTHFGNGTIGVGRFISLLVEMGLDPTEDFVRIYRDLGRGCEADYETHWLYTWVNDQLLISTTNNPINGDSARPSITSEPGWAGYIGIGGKEDAVREAAETLEGIAEAIKDKRTDGLFF